MPQESESVLHVLMYLFRNYMDETGETTISEESILDELSTAGFKKRQIVYAIDWLKGLTSTEASFSIPERRNPRQYLLRLYSDQEQIKINTECRGLISHLERIKILNSHTRELVIDRLIALKTEGIDQSLVKWVSLMVLFNQGDEHTALSFMEYLTLKDTMDGLQ